MEVAHAFTQYCDASGDAWFHRQEAWPVQAAVADWVVSRAEKTKRGHEIRRAMGIAEREEPSDNVAYVNMAAVVALDDAISSAKALGLPVPPRWRMVCDHLVLPMDGDVIVDHDGYCGEIPKGSLSTG